MYCHPIYVVLSENVQKSRPPEILKSAGYFQKYPETLKYQSGPWGWGGGRVLTFQL